MIDNLKHITHDDLFQKPGSDYPEQAAIINKYLEPFAVPGMIDDKVVCLNCELPIDGFRAALGLGVALQWGMVHGEARCSGCGWPYRGMHYIKDADGNELVTMRHFFLPYHPDGVTTREPKNGKRKA